MFINEYLKRFTRPSGRIKGDWDYRLRGLFTSNVNFNDKTVLDVGCHMGIICCEIAKLKPKAIHGIEGNKKACMVAQSIFEYVSIPSRFKRLRS